MCRIDNLFRVGVWGKEEEEEEEEEKKGRRRGRGPAALIPTGRQ